MSTNPRMIFSSALKTCTWAVLCASQLAFAGSFDTAAPTATASSPAGLALSIAHINDHHSHLMPLAMQELSLNGVATQVDVGGFARLTALFKQAQASTPNLLKIHAGDALTGTLFYTFFKGEADAQMMNTICFDAMALGNHEFDDGDAALAQFLDTLRPGPCHTAVLAANVWPQLGTPLAPRSAVDYLQPFTIKMVGGVKVGLIGITIKDKTQNSSRPLASTAFSGELASAQATIDSLKHHHGVRHIVLVTHQGFERDKAMAAQLTDVDAIIGGDSHTLLGDFSALGLSSSGSYPTVVRNKDGDLVCIGQAWEYAKAFGLMHIQFNQLGTVDSCAGQASVVLGSHFKRQEGRPEVSQDKLQEKHQEKHQERGKVWRSLSAAERTELLAALSRQPAVKVVEPDASAQAVLQRYTDRMAQEKAKTIGSASQALCLVRVPGEASHRSAGVAGCEQAHTLAKGSDAAQAVAESFLAASPRAHFALQNAGGVRVPIPAGPVSMETAFTLLPFTNVIVELDLSGQELLNALEDAASYHLDAQQSSGSHPYAAGLRWDLNMSLPKGRRFERVQVRNKATGTWQDLDRSQRYVLATNDFIAEGKDGYTALGAMYAAGRFVNTYRLYTQTFADWVSQQASVARPARSDYAHQKVVTQAGVLLP